MKVYLAGGFRSGWQDAVIRLASHHAFLDPRMHGLTEERDYTKWDLDAIKDSALVFAYLEKDNPSGAGLALEIGYAYALGKVIIFVEEPGHPHSRYFGMARQCAYRLYNDLDEGANFLSSYSYEGTDFGLDNLADEIDFLADLF